MKLNNRERQMLFAAIFIVLVAFIYFYIISPIHASYNDAVERHDLIEGQYRVLTNQREDKASIDALILDYRKDIEALEKRLPSTIHLEEIIDVIFSVFDHNFITLQSVTFSMNEEESYQETPDQMGVEKLSEAYSVKEILDAYENDIDISQLVITEEDNLLELGYDSISNLSVNLSFASNYEDLKNLLKSFENLDKTVIVSHLSTSKILKHEDDENYDDNAVTVALTLNVPFYYDQETPSEFKYNYDSTQERDPHGPFEYEVIENYENGKAIENNTLDVLEIRPDFNISLHSSASDLPAQSMSYYAFNESNLNLNANRTERYYLELSESNGQVYFKYSNNVESYPSSGGMLALTQRNDEIVIQVYSSSRITKDDLSALDLILNNKTSYKVNFYVFNDDIQEPRFNVIVNAGDYNIIRN